MKTYIPVLLKATAKRFYRENAGLFIFIFAMMFGVVGQLDGAGLMDYHYQLIYGVLNNYFFLTLVILSWIIYARKCTSFVAALFSRPEYIFVSVLELRGSRTVLHALTLTFGLLFLPVTGYGVIVIAIGIHLKLWLPATIVLLFIACTMAVCPFILRSRLLNYPSALNLENFTGRWRLRSDSYNAILWKYLITRNGLIIAGIKIYNCIVLYLLLSNNTPADYDAKSAFIFYVFGIMSHGVVIHRLRVFEEERLVFYRSLPVTITKRFFVYTIIYGALLAPEIITIAIHTPLHLTYIDSTGFVLCTYSLVLLLNSLLFAASFIMKDYLKLCLLLYLVSYFMTLAFPITFLYILFFAVAILLFFTRYFRYQ